MPVRINIKTKTENFLPVRAYVSSYHIISYHIEDYGWFSAVVNPNLHFVTICRFREIFEIFLHIS